MAERDGSSALPSYMYRDPALVAEENELRELGCRLCKKMAVTMMRAFCAEDRNPKQAGFPHRGHRCKWFDERETLVGVGR